MTRRMMRGHPAFQRFIPAKRPNPIGHQLPSSVARTFYCARRTKVMSDGRILSFQNHQTGSVITDHYRRTYHVLRGGALKSDER